ETVFYPVHVFDRLTLDRAPQGIELTCSHPELPTDSKNLVYRAAQMFLEEAKIKDGVRLHLDKHIPLAAGLGGGSGTGPTTLRPFNELFGNPLSPEQLHKLAAALGSDVAFFLQDKPALATGRGENTQSLEAFPAMKDAFIFLIHPGFGISTAWAYQHLAHFP